MICTALIIREIIRIRSNTFANGISHARETHCRNINNVQAPHYRDYSYSRLNSLYHWARIRTLTVNKQWLVPQLIIDPRCAGLIDYA